MAGLLMVALLPVAAAVSAEPATTPAPVPMAIAQPLGALGTAAGGPIGGAMLPESGLMVLVGTGLLGLAAVLRRTTGA
jgi:hypothetical protein